MDTIEKLDKIISKASNVEPFKKIVYIYKEGSDIPEKYRKSDDTSSINWSWLNRSKYEHLFFMETHENILKINLIHYKYLYSPLSVGKDWRGTPRTVYASILYLLDYLIHIKTHQFDNSIQEKYNVQHTAKFFKKKAEIRRKVIEYLTTRKINLPKLLEKYYPKIRFSRNPLYFIDPDQLCTLTYMTLRRLKHERLCLEIEKETVLEEKIAQLKNKREIKRFQREQKRKQKEGFTGNF